MCNFLKKFQMDSKISQKLQKLQNKEKLFKRLKMEFYSQTGAPQIEIDLFDFYRPPVERTRSQNK